MRKLILSLDGGGIRGAATTQFLTHVETELKNNGKSLRDCVDFYAGTSTGSIIALALATTDMTVTDINSLYSVGTAKKIFTENKGLFEIDGINAPKYEAKPKHKVLSDNFKTATLGDVADDKHVLAMAYDIEKRKPTIFKSTKKNHLTIKSAEVADASSAAPTYFPTKELKIPRIANESWLIDGGVIANNPTMCAIAEARRNWTSLTMKDFHVLSIGTGYKTRKINGPKSQKWGALQWMTKGDILDILGDERVVAYQGITMIDNGNYIRVNSELKQTSWLPNPPDDAMDDISKGNINKLKSLGDYWFKVYGDAVVQLLLDSYQGDSLDYIDPITGLPRTFP
ncbi:patatin-like phospholipase family protein [Thalassotalea euphylliae]|uniref:patatin-like phospholipase family protein n=1 Tax=Thalassotalea euphylliae TaxID=1655234 RepID=UPI0036311E84